MSEHGMLRPALIGGVLLGVLSVAPFIQAFNCVCCAWVIGGGVLAASLYVRSAPAAVTLGNGAGLGLLTGCIGGLVYILFSIPLIFLKSYGGTGFIEEARKNLLGLPDLPAGFRDAVAGMPTGGGALAVFMVFSGLLILVIFSVMGMLGGVLGVALLEKRKIGHQPAGPQPPVVIPPPPPPPPDTPEP